MGIRATLQEHPRLMIGLLFAVIAATLIYTLATAQRTEQNVEVRGGAWFTVDDGQTWFADDATKLPPYDHKGRPAYRAYVYTCDGGKTKFVAFLERYTPDAQRKLQEQRQSKTPPELSVIDRIMTFGTEVKKPGDETWVKASHPKAAVIRKPACPDGSSNTPEPVLP